MQFAPKRRPSLLASGPALHRREDGQDGKLLDIVSRAGWDRSLRPGGVKGAPIVQFASGLRLGCVFPGRFG